MKPIDELALLPCPFCGGDALYEQDRSDGPRSLRWSAGCRDETCMGYMGPTFARRKEAAASWNRRAATKAEGAQAPVAVPAGWQLVPKVATHKMIDAGVCAGVFAIPKPWCPETWAAMLKAAPEPPK